MTRSFTPFLGATYPGSFHFYVTGVTRGWTTGTRTTPKLWRSRPRPKITSSCISTTYPSCSDFTSKTSTTSRRWSFRQLTFYLLWHLVVEVSGEPFCDRYPTIGITANRYDGPCRNTGRTSRSGNPVCAVPVVGPWTGVSTPTTFCTTTSSVTLFSVCGETCNVRVCGWPGRLSSRLSPSSSVFRPVCPGPSSPYVDTTRSRRTSGVPGPTGPTKGLLTYVCPPLFSVVPRWTVNRLIQGVVSPNSSIVPSSSASDNSVTPVHILGSSVALDQCLCVFSVSEEFL